MKIVLKIFFLIFSNANVQFAEQQLTWRIYTPAEIILITKKIEIINQKEFAIAILDLKEEVFIVYITSLSLMSKMLIYLIREV